ncbi:3-oxoacyl-(acyl-carrier-protein) reductase [Syntrophobotulus glycolicus DSM 8271]|uniref:3-oxoacyl-(Acyl-carrier-protein) reductase n=1 Tax=Syntrophobotulus glycolicus (strain DSM 8271 / FlGlyR) TaxID=645991 RepID=F0SWJ9_SYNGF|nr:SDR family oxidoreductase [Syntrophobotulus glycolicus]ADY56839.1 3-oxoacyl-(acyl-carrier-protein) reductase [Syntrophobotulus glycolicus DSM 8271]
MNYDQEFAGKHVVITGAAGIFGSWIAKAFAGQGASLCLSDIREDKLKELIRDPLFKNTEFIVHRTDLSEPNSVADLCAVIEKEWSAPDILINNAGLYHRQILMDMPPRAWEEFMAVNLTAPFLLTQNLTKLMIQGKIPGSVINIISGAAFSVQVGGGPYSVSKAALAMLTRAFALELAPHGIRVNSVAPGFAPGSEVSHLTDDYVSKMVESIPLGRTSGPEDAPQAVLFLCSAAAAFITGATLTVDGGRTAGTYKRNHGLGK